MTSWWVRWSLKSPASRLFTQPVIQAQIKENIKALRHWPFVWGIHRRPVNPPHKGPVTRKMFPFDDVIMVGALCGRGTTVIMRATLIARFMGPTWGSSGADRTQVGPMLAPWTLLSGQYCKTCFHEIEVFLCILLTQSIGFHPWRHVDCVAKQAVSRHRLTDYTWQKKMDNFVDQSLSNNTRSYNAHFQSHKLITNNFSLGLLGDWMKNDRYE